MYLVVKRLIDTVVAAIAIVLLSPLFLLIMIILRLSGEGEVFYRQERIGYKKKPFGILKFATMLKDSPNIGTRSITLPKDPRVLPIGTILRKTKINELPQIFNVLIGDMSIVGPRPLVDKNFNAYPDHVQAEIYDCKPGVTGIGSIIFRDEESMFSQSDLSPADLYCTEIAPYKGQLEIWYKQNRSTITDMIIIVLTAWVILFPAFKLPYRVFPGLPGVGTGSPAHEGRRRAA